MRVPYPASPTHPPRTNDLLSATHCVCVCACVQMVDTENNDEQVSATETAAAGKVCVICNGKSGRPLKGKRCTADKCKKEYAALWGKTGEMQSAVWAATVPLFVDAAVAQLDVLPRCSAWPPVGIQLPRRL